MKQIISVVALFLTIGASFAQTDPAKAEHTITKDISLPTQKEVGKKTLEGSYIFIVELDGSVKEVTVKDSLGFGIDEQVVNKLKENKEWKVAEFGGEPKRIQYKLPVKIKLPKK